MPNPVVESKSLTTPCMTGESSGPAVSFTVPLVQGAREREGGRDSDWRLGEPLDCLRLLDLAGLQTRRADADPTSVGAVADPNALYVRKPASTGPLVREADLLPVPRFLSTDFTTKRHDDLLRPVGETSSAVARAAIVYSSPVMYVHLTADHLKRVLTRYHQRLGTYRDALNRLNVYPVPDGDTGTNMELTVGTVVDEVAAAHGMREVTAALAHGSLMGARGNSGVILAQILRGLADTFGGADSVGVQEIVEGLEHASKAAYRAVLHPVEGTILTVLREAAEAAASTRADSDLGALLDGVYQRAERSLESTPSMLPVLARAGVVDAGGAGLLLLFAALLEETTGTEVPLPESIFDATPVDLVEVGIGGQRYEVVLMLDAPDERVEAFRDEWDRLGESIVIVGGDGHYKCHIHTDQPAAAIEAGLWIDGHPVGTFRNLSITDLQMESIESDSVSVVAVATGSGMASIFRELGAATVVDGGQGMNPSVRDLLRAVDLLRAPTVILLPNNKNIVPAANEVVGLTEKHVVVVPTTSMPEGIGAMMEYLPGRDVDQMIDAMVEASRGVASGEVTKAVRDARVEIGEVTQGQWLAITHGKIVFAGSDLGDVLCRLVAELSGDGTELVTLFTGAGATEEATAAVRRRFGVEVEVRNGGQPLYPYLVSVE